MTEETRQEVAAAKSIPELSDIFARHAAGAGAHYSLLACKLDPYLPTQDVGVVMGNFPMLWVPEAIQKGLLQRNVFLDVLKTRSSAFYINDFPELIRIRDEVRNAGLQHFEPVAEDVLVVPLRLPDVLTKFAFFGCLPGEAFPKDRLSCLQFLATVVFDRAVEFAKCEASEGTAPVITLRQVECLQLLARGMKDNEIGDALGISQNTVRNHISAAKEYYQVESRLQLVLKALISGDISEKILVDEKMSS